jgi:type I restriction enzyme M protein
MQGKQLRKLENELWRAADQLRANSKLTASEYSMPVLGLIFLRHAYNRFLVSKLQIEEELPVHPQRGRKPITKEDFLSKNSIFLPEISRFDYLVNIPEGGIKVEDENHNTVVKNIGEILDMAMKAIEDEYSNLKGVLPKNYSIFSKELLQELLRIFNKEVLQKATGDLFGKIYEYFLNKFAMTGAQEGGEFFTPLSLVQTIVNVIEPDYGIVFDPALGSAGMFVQTGYFIEEEGMRPAEKVTFFGQEKTETNTRLAKMNLAVHGLEGHIQEGNTFYDDKHNLFNSCDFVMANPPFNVDGVDKEKIKKDQRLPFGLPKNDNANYLWIQYFYSYLKPNGRAGFVMASSASDAGHSEKEIREKLVKTGAVDVMFAIGNNFFYTRSLPCTLWFFDRAKENNPERKDTVLMLDARKIYHKVTQKVNDFSPEQLNNLICIVNLYRGNGKKYIDTVNGYLTESFKLAKETSRHQIELFETIDNLLEIINDFALDFVKKNETAEKWIEELKQTKDEANSVFEIHTKLIESINNADITQSKLEPVAELCKSIRKPQDKLFKQIFDLVSNTTKEYQLNKIKEWKELGIKEKLDNLKAIHLELSGNPDEEEPGLLHDIRYFWKEALWLSSRFPDGKYRDVEGLCRVVNTEEIASKDYSLSPGRYVGVDVATDDDFDYETRLQEIHIELQGLNEEAVKLADLINENFKGLF